MPKASKLKKLCHNVRKNNEHKINFLHKLRYHTYIDLIFGWVACLWLSSWGFLLSSLRFWTYWYSPLGTPPGHRSSAPAVQCFAPHTGRHSAPRPFGPSDVLRVDFQYSPAIVKNVKLISKKPELSATKNLSVNKNISICLISPSFAALVITLPTFLANFGDRSNIGFKGK